MKAIIFVVLFFAVVFCTKELQTRVLEGSMKPTEDVSFTIYKSLYKHDGQREDKHFKNFHTNLQRMHEINKMNLGWTAGINQFSFMSYEEYKTHHLGASGESCRLTAELTLLNKANKKSFSNEGIPEAFDWRDDRKVSAVKDQQDCASSWSFAATGALESHWAILTGTAPPSLSEQQLVDCAHDFKNQGCQGGLPSQAFEYIRHIGGINQENVYLYLANKLDVCFYDKSVNQAYVKGGAVNITFQDEAELQNAVWKRGPVTVAFQALPDFQHYVGGIYENPACSTQPQDVNHAVLVVGWGNLGGKPYWIVKNSFNDRWGENGFFRIARGVNMCGIADCASYPEILSQ